MEFTQRETQNAALGARGKEIGRAWCATHLGDGVQCAAQRLGVVGLDGGNPAYAEAESTENRLGEINGSYQSGNVVSGPRPQEETHGHRAVGEGGGDTLQPDLGHLVDSERKCIGRQAVTMTRQCMDQFTPVRLIVQQHDRTLPAGFAVGCQQGAQLAHQGIGWGQCIGGGAGRANGCALATAGADLRVDRHVIAGRRDGAGRAKIEAAGAPDNARARIGAQGIVECYVARLLERAD